MKGHAGAHLNECADRLAQLGRTGLDLYQSRDRIDEIAARHVQSATVLAQAS